MSVEEKVKEIIAEQLGVKKEEIKPESSFVEDLGADSLDTVEVVVSNRSHHFNVARKPQD